MKFLSANLIAIFVAMAACKHQATSTVESANIGDSSVSFLSGLGFYDYDVTEVTDVSDATDVTDAAHSKQTTNQHTNITRKMHFISSEYFSDYDEVRNIKSDVKFGTANAGDSEVFDINFGEDKKLGFFLYFDFADKNLVDNAARQNDADSRLDYTVDYWIVNDQAEQLQSSWPEFYDRYKTLKAAQQTSGIEGLTSRLFYLKVESFVKEHLSETSSGNARLENSGIKMLPGSLVPYPTETAVAVNSRVLNQEKARVDAAIASSQTPGSSINDGSAGKSDDTVESDAVKNSAGMHVFIKDFGGAELKKAVTDVQIKNTDKTQNIFLIATVKSKKLSWMHDGYVGIQILKILPTEKFANNTLKDIIGKNVLMDDPQILGNDGNNLDPTSSSNHLDCVAANTGKSQTFYLKRSISRIVIRSTPGQKGNEIATKNRIFTGNLTCNSITTSGYCWFETSVGVHGKMVTGYFNSKNVLPSAVKCDRSIHIDAKK